MDCGICLEVWDVYMDLLDGFCDESMDFWC